MDVRTIHESTVSALEGKVAFPKIVETLGELGIERYYTDFVRMEKIFYDNKDQSCLERIPMPSLPVVAHDFTPAKIVEALEGMRGGKLNYPEFVRNLMVAGVATLTIYIEGKLAVFNGRKGENYVERIFPPKS